MLQFEKPSSPIFQWLVRHLPVLSSCWPQVDAYEVGVMRTKVLAKGPGNNDTLSLPGTLLFQCRENSFGRDIMKYAATNNWISFPAA